MGFDIHCYGRDVSFSKVNFSDKYNQLNSIFGDIVFDRCTFTNYDPIRIGSSYNAYVPYDVYFNDCVFNASGKNKCLLRIGVLDDEENTRKELKEKCWPNVYIKNLTVNLDKGIRDFTIYYASIDGRESQIPIHNISTIDVDGMKINSPYDDIVFSITPKQVKTIEEVSCVVEKVSVNGKRINTNDNRRIRTNMPLRNGVVRSRYSKLLKRK